MRITEKLLYSENHDSKMAFLTTLFLKKAVKKAEHRQCSQSAQPLFSNAEKVNCTCLVKEWKLL